MLDSFLGLPAHPLIVHAPVVLVPLASLGLLDLLLRPAWRPRYAGLLLVGLVAAALGAIAAAVSGNAFAERVGLPVSHQSYGTALAAVSVALAVAGGSWLWLVRREREASPRLTTLGWTAGAVSRTIARRSSSRSSGSATCSVRRLPQRRRRRTSR